MGAGINIFVQDTAKIIVTQAYDRSWAKPNETLALGPQKFKKKLHRKKFSKIFFRLSNLLKKKIR